MRKGCSAKAEFPIRYLKTFPRLDRLNLGTGTFSQPYRLCTTVIAAAAIFLTLNGLSVQPSHAQNPDPAPHERFHEYYQRWKQPGGISCCNANEYMEWEGKRTHIYGDCEPTTAHLVNGHWFARVPQYLIDKGADEFVEVPDSRVNREINPSPNEAHLCATENWDNGKLKINVLCFVPPFGGG